LPVNGRQVTFTENVFYILREDKIELIWSVIDKAAIEAQLQQPGPEKLSHGKNV
jgi:predicted ester cyclase